MVRRRDSVGKLQRIPPIRSSVYYYKKKKKLSQKNQNKKKPLHHFPSPYGEVVVQPPPT